MKQFSPDFLHYERTSVQMKTIEWDIPEIAQEITLFERQSMGFVRLCKLFELNTHFEQQLTL